MALIEKTLATPALTSVSVAPAEGESGTLWPGLLARIGREIAQRQAHPARVLVLLPYGQLLPLANRLWARHQPQGFAPRFETTQSWARAWGAHAAAPQAGDDYRFDAALDSLTARHLLERAGLGHEQESLLPRLLQACAQLAGRAAAVPPAQRADWATQTLAGLPGGFDCEALRLDAAVTHLALAWASSSGYGTDVLWGEDGRCAAQQSVDCLIVLEGLQADPLTQALAARFGDKALSLPLAVTAEPGHTRVYPAQDFEEEALWAAACVLRRVEARQQAMAGDASAGVDAGPGALAAGPVALVAIDRTLTRRIGAMLETQGVTVRDDTGWTLSTTRAAATLMTSLQACGWQASSDAVLDWLKNAPAFPEALVGRLENLLRQARCGLWRDRVVPARDDAREDKPLDATAMAQKTAQQEALRAFDQHLQALLDRMQAPRPLRQWLADLVQHLQMSGLWQTLLTDAAGEAVVKALHLGDAAQSALTGWPLAGRRLRLDEFSGWVRQALEAASFLPPPQAAVQVIILPLAQLLARSFSAVVLPGCDEVRLSPSPEMPGNWTGPERLALGLASREEAAAALRTAWQQALQQAEVDVLWRQTDSGGETLLPSPLLQLWLLTQPGASSGAAPVPDPVDGLCVSRLLTPAPTLRPNPQGQALPVRRLSASAYEDLRRCPYRFFALRQLGLKEMGELDNEFEKRDYGDWLHEVLKIFHQGLADPGTDLQMAALTDQAARRDLLDRCAEQTLERRKFSPGEFLPYRAAWPDLRDAYLRWLDGHEAGGGRFESAETWHEMGLGSITLVGRIDRIDSTASPHPADDSARPAYVLDYKTESPGTTQQRLKDPLEDTQLAFYAALLPNDSLRAAYVNLNERDGTKTYEQDEVVPARDALIDGILSDMKRIDGGAVLAALGEGAACDYCAARGLCRKDFWEQQA